MKYLVTRYYKFHVQFYDQLNSHIKGCSIIFVKQSVTSYPPLQPHLLHKKWKEIWSKPNIFPHLD